jgi:hypothetical protein
MSVSFQCNFDISRVNYYRFSLVAAFHIFQDILVADNKQMARSTPLVYVNTGRILRPRKCEDDLIAREMKRTCESCVSSDRGADKSLAPPD